MERHDTTMRAARYLFGVGTFAAAMVAVAASPASAQTDVCLNTEVPVCGHVFTEIGTADGFELGEGIDTVQVVLTDSTGTQKVETYQTNPQGTYDCSDVNSESCGYYEFAAVTPGDYKVCVVVNGVYTDCRDVPIGTIGNTEDFAVNSGGENSTLEDAEPPYKIYGSGTGTPGYWKNHPEAWPAEGVTIGGVKYLNQPTAALPDKTITDAIKLMGKVSGDKTYSMFAALISAKLNTMVVLGNNYDCVVGTMSKADTWMTEHPVGSGVKASSDAWTVGEPWHQKLDDYNNGKLCAPHRD